MGAAPMALERPVMPGERYTLTICMNSPAEPGNYHSKWRLCTPQGAYFGDPMWIVVTVIDPSTIALTDQLSHFNELGAPLTTSVPVNPFRSYNILPVSTR